MTIRFTPLGCKVRTTYEPAPNGTLTQHITLSCETATHLTLVADEAEALELADRPRVEVNLPPRYRP
jgi:hypothetical protein